MVLIVVSHKVGSLLVPTLTVKLWLAQPQNIRGRWCLRTHSRTATRFGVATVVAAARVGIRT